MIGLATLLASATQAATQEEFATSIKKAHVEATRTATLLQNTLDSLNALTKQKGGDLRPAYSNYCALVAKTEAASATAGCWTAGWM